MGSKRRVRGSRFLAPPSILSEGRTGLQLARLVEQRFLRMELHRSPCSPARAVGAHRARSTRLGGKHEHAPAILSWSQIGGGLPVRAGTGPSLQIDPKRRLGGIALVVNFWHLGDQ